MAVRARPSCLCVPVVSAFFRAVYVATACAAARARALNQVTMGGHRRGVGLFGPFSVRSMLVEGVQSFECRVWHSAHRSWRLQFQRFQLQPSPI